MAKYFIIAGEASGDIHAAALIAQIRLRDPEAQFTGLGGDQMVAADCRLHQHIRHMAFMGYVEVLRNIHHVRRNFRLTEEALLAEQPDALILIDYPSFNLKIAAYCRKHLPQTKIYYYIPPKVWAWKRRRIHAIARLCDEVLGIFPFEPAFYAKYGYRCTYIGNPTAEEVANHKSQITNHKSSIALLPGSRPSEVRKCLVTMLEAARQFPEYSITVCAAPGLDDTFYTPFLRAGETLTRDTYSTVQQATAAIVNSGTATLETALLGCPQVAVYQIAFPRIVGLILKLAHSKIFSIPYFTLVNIIEGKQVIRECIADNFTVENIATELKRILTDEAYTKEMLASYEHLSSLLGTQPAAATAAAIITSKR
jgi:lipid-A-disaccharide synthase